MLILFLTKLSLRERKPTIRPKLMVRLLFQIIAKPDPVAWDDTNLSTGRKSLINS